MESRRSVAWSVVVFTLCGCTTTKLAKGHQFSTTPQKQDQQALRTVADTVAGVELTDSQFQKLGQDIRQNPETRSAVQAVTGALGGEKPAMKYSPATGKRYAPNLEYDPETGVKLLPVE